MNCLRPIALVGAIMMLSGCGQPAVVIVNDTQQPVKVDVTLSNDKRAPFFRELNPGIAFNSNICANKVDRIYVEINNKDYSVIPASACAQGGCDCRINVSMVSRK